MANQLTLITGNAGDAWARDLATTLDSLGSMQILTEKDFASGMLSPACELVLIDATTVKTVEYLIAEISRGVPNRRVLVMTASPDWQLARAAFQAGAFDYISKNLHPDELHRKVARALERPALCRVAYEDEKK